MGKKQWKNLYHSYRWMKQYTGSRQAFAWIAHLDPQAAKILMIAILD